MTYPSIPFLSDTISLAGTSIKWVVILTPFLVAALVLVLTQLINHTKVGMAMRAVAKDFETSQLMGIKINSVISVTFVIGSALAAVGSMLYFTTYPAIVPTAGAMPGLKAFVAAVFGGTHLVEAGKDRILNTVNVLREMGMETLGLSHCSGDAAEALARDVSGVRVCHLACGDSIFLE